MNGRQANWEQFKAILWLRWRLLNNQMAKTGKFNLVLTMILIWSLFVLSAISLFLTFGLGAIFLRYAEPFHAMIIWDVLIGVFLLLWFIGLMTELQRSEFLSLEKMLQLPMSLKSAFALNYLTSLCTLAMILIVPTALGLILAFGFTHGPALLLMLAPFFGLIWCVTAVTYQFRGWIAGVMVNERRRRRVVVGMTLAFIALTQIPNFALQYAVHRPDANNELQKKKLAEARAEILADSKDEADRATRLKEVENQHILEQKSQRDARARQRERYLTLANTWIPFGWPALCCKQLMSSQIFMSFVLTLAMLAVGSLSFWRAYVTTLRIYTRDDGAGGRRKQTEISSSQSASSVRKTNWLERTIPWMSEHVSTVAIASLVNLLRAPESKMALIGPLSMLGVLGAIMFGRRKATIPDGVEGFLLLGSVGLILFFMSILSMNLFGMDRSSFRAYILMPVRRHEILAGKNLALLPLFAIMVVPTMLLINLLVPVSLLCNVATLVQGVSILAGVTLLGNLISIYFPMPMAAGTARPVQMNFKVVGMQMLATFAFPLFLIPGMIALGIELALQHFAHISYLPIYLCVSILQLLLAGFIYRRLIAEQGEMLQSRETKILETLAVHAE